MSLVKVRLELARNAEQPQGSSECGYEFTAPLTADGHLDPEGWQREREACRVHRFWRGERDQYGQLVHGDRRWLFHYDRTDEDEDEPIFRLEQHRFVPGEYVSVTEHDGVQRTFRVVEAFPTD